MLVNALALSLAVAVIAAPMSAVPAAAVHELPAEFSLDGVHWTSTIPEILPEGWQPVPGSTQTATVHVRSTRDTLSRVSLSVGAATSPSTSLLNATQVAGRLQSVDLSTVDACRALDEAVLAPGESATFPLSVSVSPALTDAQQTPLSFALAATMSDPELTAGPGCGADPIAASPDLPATGGDAQRTAAVAAAGIAASLAGLWLLVRRRREARDV